MRYELFTRYQTISYTSPIEEACPVHDQSTAHYLKAAASSSSMMIYPYIYIYINHTHILFILYLVDIYMVIYMSTYHSIYYVFFFDDTHYYHTQISHSYIHTRRIHHAYIYIDAATAAAIIFLIRLLYYAHKLISL